MLYNARHFASMADPQMFIDKAKRDLSIINDVDHTSCPACMMSLFDFGKLFSFIWVQLL